MLVQFLSRMPQLEGFHLATSGDNTFTVSCIHKVLRDLPFGLKEFHLFNFLVTVPVLCVFLNAHRQNLEQIGLCRIFLTRERWTWIFGIMNPSCCLAWRTSSSRSSGNFSLSSERRSFSIIRAATPVRRMEYSVTESTASAREAVCPASSLMENGVRTCVTDEIVALGEDD